MTDDDAVWYAAVPRDAKWAKWKRFLRILYCVLATVEGLTITLIYVRPSVPWPGGLTAEDVSNLMCWTAPYAIVVGVVFFLFGFLSGDTLTRHLAVAVLVAPILRLVHLYSSLCQL